MYVCLYVYIYVTVVTICLYKAYTLPVCNMYVCLYVYIYVTVVTICLYKAYTLPYVICTYVYMSISTSLSSPSASIRHIYGHQLKMKQSFVWKTNVKKWNNLKAVGTFKNNVLVGHVPIELLRLIYYFLKSDSSANVFAKVKGERKREIGLVVPALYMTTADMSEMENGSLKS